MEKVNFIQSTGDIFCSLCGKYFKSENIDKITSFMKKHKCKKVRIEFMQDYKQKAKKELLDDLEKLLTKNIREEKRKPETQHRLGIIRALSYVRREVKKRHLSTFEKQKEHN